MELDDTGWSDAQAGLAQVDLPEDDVRVLVAHLRDRLVSHFGAEHIDVWRAKEGLHRHPVDEVAAVAIAKLAPLLDQLDEGSVRRAIDDGSIGRPIRFPWDEPFPFG